MLKFSGTAHPSLQAEQRTHGRRRPGRQASHPRVGWAVGDGVEPGQEQRCCSLHVNVGAKVI
jgi:hypothetical protein